MKRLIMALINFYRRHITTHTKPKCKYYPTCSKYALDAVEKHGACKGCILAAWRLLRCNPFSMGGIDYVPEKFTLRVEKYNYHQRENDSSEENQN